MLKYYVIWILASWQIGSCPDADKPNAFGVVRGGGISCVVMHTEKRERTLSREFKSKRQAVEFLDSITAYKKSQNRTFQLMGVEQVEDIRLDSLKIK